LELFADRYEIRALLGTGAMGSVFLARDRQLDELVAVKMLKPTTDQRALERFRDEVRLARRVTHRNVARTYDIGEHCGEWFLTMEFVAGESLARRLERLGALPVAECLRIAIGICDGLAAAHDVGVIHRDLKPANIMLAEADRVVITDFGVATRHNNADGLIAGTPLFMAPEQLAGGPADERSDLYSLGAILHRMTTGRRAFCDAYGDRSVVPNPCQWRAGLPSELGSAILKCMSVRSGDRYACARELAAALGSVGCDDANEEPAPTLRIPSRIDRMPRVVSVRLPFSSAFASALRSAIVEHLEQYAALRVSDEGTAEAMIDLAIERDGERVRVRMDASSGGMRFWSAISEAPISGAADLGAAAATRIATALGLDVPDARSHGPLPPEAVEPYLEARLHLRGIAESDLDVARATLERLETLVPGHPLVVSSLALARARGAFYRPGDLEAAIAGAEDAVRRAPDLADSHLALGVSQWQGARGDDATRSLLRALALAPGNADAKLALARILIESGAPSQGIDLARVAVQRVPSLEIAWLEIGRACLLFDRHSDALEAYAHLRPVAQHNYAAVYKCRFATWHRDTASVGRVLASVDDALLYEGSRVLFRFYERVVMGNQAPRVIAENTNFALGSSPRFRVFVQQVWTELALFAADWGFALHALKRAVEEGLADVFWIDRCPLFAELLGNVRFELLRDAVRARARAALVEFDRACRDGG
jgi:eukaryotic-like serine/threonine-protein kinase